MRLFALLPAFAAAVMFVTGAASARPHGQLVQGSLQGGVLLYAAGGGDVAIYEALQQGHREIGTLQGFSDADAVAVDPAHNVYVADKFAQKIYVYARNSFFPFRILDDPQGDPVALALSSDGTVYAANQIQNAYEGGVVSYAPGATTPTSTLTIPSSAQTLMYALAVDAHGTLFVRYDTQDYSYNITQYLIKILKGSSQLQIVPIGLLFESQGSGMVFDADGRLLISDPVIAVYDLPHRLFKHYFGTGIGIAFDHSGRRLFSADPTGGDIYEYAYPSGKLLDTITKASTAGVAVDPPEFQ